MARGVESKEGRRSAISTFGIVALSLFAGLLLALILGAALALIFLIYKTCGVLSSCKSDLRSDLSSVRSGLDAQQKEIAIALSKINGDALSRASLIIQNSAKRIEQAALAIGELVVAPEMKHYTGGP